MDRKQDEEDMEDRHRAATLIQARTSASLPTLIQARTSASLPTRAA